MELFAVVLNRCFIPIADSIFCHLSLLYSCECCILPSALLAIGATIFGGLSLAAFIAFAGISFDNGPLGSGNLLN